VVIAVTVRATTTAKAITKIAKKVRHFFSTRLPVTMYEKLVNRIMVCHVGAAELSKGKQKAMPDQHKPGGLRALLYREIAQLIDSGSPLSDEAFNAVALRLFRYQLSANSVYRGFFEAARRNAPDHWKNI